MLKVIALSAFSDNYIWVLKHDNDSRVAVVDPGDAEPVLSHLKSNNLELGAILITHHHPDHTGGLKKLLAQADVPVYGPAAENYPIEGLSARLAQDDQVTIDWLDVTFDIIEVPGHTAGHIAFHGAGMLFSGDTLFSGGCGKLFEGDAAQMRHSLEKLRALPSDNLIYCGHEYTEKNLAFAQAVEPDNNALQDRIETVKEQRTAGQPSLPSRLDDELQFNPFLRWDAQPVIKAACERAGKDSLDEDAVFAEIRAWKDEF